MIGLKENVIIGKLIPAGTGMKRYKSIEIDTEKADNADVIQDIVFENVGQENL